MSDGKAPRRASTAARTVGELLATVEAGVDGAWLMLRAEARACVGGLRHGALDDSVHDILLRAFDHDAAAMRRADPQTPLRVWIRAILRNITLQGHREHKWEKTGLNVDQAATRGFDYLVVRNGWDGVDMACLTAAQREAVVLALEGASERRIATHLRVSRRAVRDRLARATRRLRSRACQHAVERLWAIEALIGSVIFPGKAPQDTTREMLHLYAGGRTHRQVARLLGTTKDAIRKRIGRLRRWHNANQSV